MARAAAEWEIRKPRDALREIPFPAFWAEFFGLVVPARVALNNPLRHCNTHPFSHGITAELVVLNRNTGQAPRGRIEAHGFRDYICGIREAREVVDRRCAADEHFVEFGVQFRFRGWILREQPPRP